MPVQYLDTRVLDRRENLEALRDLPEASIDLIYLDPPFFSNRRYEVIWGEEAEVRSFEDRWGGGIQTYLEWMGHRLAELRRVLKPTGSIWLHCDPHASHYLKVIMDELFGMNNFRNEIIWKRTGAHGAAKRCAPVHDTLLYYGGPKQTLWNRQYHEYKPGYVATKYAQKDGRGRYQLVTLVPSGLRNGETGQPWRGIDPSAKGLHWRYRPGKLDELDSQGMIVWGGSREKLPRLKRYLKADEGIALQDIWVDIPPLNSQARERLGYPTQKPEALMARIIQASSNPGDIVLDPFCGCGTTISVAEKLGREWIGIDIGTSAINIVRDRLNSLANVRPFKTLNMPETVADLRILKPFEFQNWVIRKFYGTASPRLSHDMGIDGYTLFERDPIQVKRSDSVGRNVVDNFETAMRRGGHSKGFIVAFSFTSGARAEAARARWNDSLEVTLLTVEQLLMEQPKDVVPELGRLEQLPLRAVRNTDSMPSPDELIQSARTAAIA